MRPSVTVWGFLSSVSLQTAFNGKNGDIFHLFFSVKFNGCDAVHARECLSFYSVQL